MSFFPQQNPPLDPDQDMPQQPQNVPVYVPHSQPHQFHQQQQSLRPSSQEPYSQLQLPLHQLAPPQAPPPQPQPQQPPQQTPDTPIHSFDLGDLSVPDLLNGINPELIEYLQNNTPQVLSALIEQDNRNHHLAQSAALSTHPQQVLLAADNSNVSSYITDVISPTNSASSRDSIPQPNLVPLTSRSQLNPHPIPTPNPNPPSRPARTGAAAAVAAAAAAASAAAAVSRPLSQDPNLNLISPMSRNHPVMPNHPHISPTHPHLQPAARHPQFSLTNSGITPDHQAALNAAARAQANPQRAQLNPDQIRMMSQSANVLVAQQAAQSRPHPAAPHPQLTPHQARVSPVSSAPLQSHVASVPASVPTSVPTSVPASVPTQTVSPNAAKAKISDRRAKVRAKDTHRPTVKKEDTRQAPASLKRPAPSSRVDPTPNQSAMPASAMPASQLQHMPVKMEDPSIGDTDTGEEDVEVKKAMRAERNRQSAAASRERKKHHIKELERRVKQLSHENAKLQVEQLQTIHERLAKEKQLVEENTELKRQVMYKSMEISKLSHELEKVRVHLEPEDPVLKRPSTWDAAEWGSNRHKIKSR